MAVGNANGLTMVLKAMGFDPAVVVGKAEELERLVKAGVLEVQAKVASTDARLARIEGMLLALTCKVDASRNERILPAGECEEMYETALVEMAKEKRNGHHS